MENEFVEVCLFTIGVMWFGTSGMMSCRDVLGGVTKIGVFLFFFCVLLFCLLLFLDFLFYIFFSSFTFVIEDPARMPGESSRMDGHGSRG